VVGTRVLIHRNAHHSVAKTSGVAQRKPGFERDGS
jgi:hypothetical protein